MTRRPVKVALLQGLALTVHTLSWWLEELSHQLGKLVDLLDNAAGTCSECGEWHPDGWTGPAEEHR